MIKVELSELPEPEPFECAGMQYWPFSSNSSSVEPSRPTLCLISRKSRQICCLYRYSIERIRRLTVLYTTTISAYATHTRMSRDKLRTNIRFISPRDHMVQAEIPDCRQPSADKVRKHMMH